MSTGKARRSRRVSRARARAERGRARVVDLLRGDPEGDGSQRAVDLEGLGRGVPGVAMRRGIGAEAGAISEIHERLTCEVLGVRSDALGARGRPQDLARRVATRLVLRARALRSRRARHVMSAAGAVRVHEGHAVEPGELLDLDPGGLRPGRDGLGFEPEVFPQRQQDLPRRAAREREGQQRERRQADQRSRPGTTPGSHPRAQGASASRTAARTRSWASSAVQPARLRSASRAWRATLLAFSAASSAVVR